MKTTLIIYLSCVIMLGSVSTGLSRGLNPPEEKQSTAQAQSPAFIYPNPVIPLPKNQGGNKNLPQSGGEYKQVKMPEFTQEQKKCITSFVNKGMTTCLEDIGNSFVTEKIGVRPDCCSALDGLTDSCRLVIHFQNQVFEDDVKKFCTSLSGAGTDGSGVEDGSGSEAGFKDGSFGDTTGQLDDGFGSAFGPGPAEGPSPSGSYDESYGPGVAEGPNAFEPSEEVGPVIEGSSPISSESGEEVGPNVEGSSPSEEVGPSDEGSGQGEEVGPNEQGSGQGEEAGPSDEGAGQNEEAGPSDEGAAQNEEAGPGDEGAGQPEESGPNNEGSGQGEEAGSNNEGSGQGDESTEGAVGPLNEPESPNAQ
ncbi:hypothetical protein RND81_05G254900 [Saponaria officinalis]|uniref:Prolamin-like domain-containing protein n=1 Tax=Saponaria officinalis TaxID=3572 RepID=A0AAW1L0T8_SAPOF